jgi:hypothetical protein
MYPNPVGPLMAVGLWYGFASVTVVQLQEERPRKRQGRSPVRRYPPITKQEVGLLSAAACDVYHMSPVSA